MLNLCIRKGISLPRFSVVLSLAALCIGNGIHLSRSAHTSQLFFALDKYLPTCSQEAEAALRSAGVYDTENFSSVGVAGIFAFFANPKAPLGEVFLNEFVSVRGQVHIADHD